MNILKLVQEGSNSTLLQSMQWKAINKHSFQELDGFAVILRNRYLCDVKFRTGHIQSMPYRLARASDIGRIVSNGC